MEPSRPDVLGALVDLSRDIGNLPDSILLERDRDALGGEQRLVLLEERRFRLGQDPPKVLDRQRVQFHPNRESALEFRDEVRWPVLLKRSGANIEDVVRPERSVARGHRRTVEEGQQVPLHAFARDVGSGGVVGTRDLVQFVDEDDPVLFGALERQP